MTDSVPPVLILASSSPYRRELLGRLRVPFVVERPDVNETALPSEMAPQTAQRLARLKASHVASQHRNALVIGSDQVASWAGQHIGKPGTHDRALEQLLQFQGQEVLFYSALCVIDTRDQMVREELACVSVRFRRLPREQLERYLRLEEPYDCAGSAKSEGLGIALIEKIDSDDPSALVGLPLIRLVSLLTQAGFSVLDETRLSSPR